MNDSLANNKSGKPKIVVVGGIAGGASCAARARRLSEDAAITIFERGSHVSFASCGLPYYVGNIIKEEKDLLVATPELFQNRFNIDVKLHHEVLKINRSAQTVEVKNLNTGVFFEESYSALVLSPGSVPIRPGSLELTFQVFLLSGRCVTDSRSKTGLLKSG